MAGEVRTRVATDADMDAIADVLVASYAQYMPESDAALSPEEREAWEGYRAEIKDVRSRLPHSTYIVAEHDGKLVGSVSYYAAGEADSAEHAFADGWASIRLLGVHPSARGLGVGRVLMDACIERAREEKCTAIALHTTFLMDVARAMYVRMGFERVPDYDFFPMPDFTVEAYKLDL